MVVVPLSYRDRKWDDWNRSQHARPFRGVDGEGGNVSIEGTLFPDITRHQYLSLRAGTFLLETGKPLKWHECFKFLSELPAKRFLWVAYFFDYDVTMMIRTLPMEVAVKLMQREKRARFSKGLNTTIPVEATAPDGTVYEFDYLPHKEFTIRKKGTRHWVVISDTGQFFQGSFLSSLKKWNIGTPDEQNFIEKNKAMRADFAESTDETRAYNAVECMLLAQLMESFREVCYGTGYVPKKWQGPGNLASAMLTKHGVPRRKDVPILQNPAFRDLAQWAYYGGRFETTACGPIYGPVYQYDINGAYVHMLKSLPCLIHGTWTRVFERPDSRLWFGKVGYSHPAKRMLYNLPHRLKDGNIRYQREGNGVYWSSEIGAAERAGTCINRFYEGWVYHGSCDCRWFDFVDDYYARRLALGKSTKGYVLKLAGNSIYGKLAQSIGYAPWANPVWAGMITAGCRAMLTDAYRQSPDNCYMLATDGLFMSKQLKLPVSKNLGEWEETIHPHGMFIIQPGVYFIGTDAKTRGVERGRINKLREEFEESWEIFRMKERDYTPVAVEVTNFITAKQAIARGKWNIAGTWEKTTKDVSFNWDSKRQHGRIIWQDVGLHQHMRTVPYEGNPADFSVSYGRQIGGGLRVSFASTPLSETAREAERMSEQPDWVEPLFAQGEQGQESS